MTTSQTELKKINLEMINPLMVEELQIINLDLEEGNI